MSQAAAETQEGGAARGGAGAEQVHRSSATTLEPPGVADTLVNIGDTSTTGAEEAEATAEADAGATAADGDAEDEAFTSENETAGEAE